MVLCKAICIFLLALSVIIDITNAANACPTITCSTSLDNDVCMQLDGTTGADATFSFRPCSSLKFCDYKNIETLHIFQRYDDATALPTAVRKKAYCVSREVNHRDLLPGARCVHDYECLSGRCDSGIPWGGHYGKGRCRGQYNDET